MAYLYIIIGLVAWRNATGFIAWHNARTYNQKSLDSQDVVLGTFFGFFCGMFWPVYLAFRGTHYVHLRWIKDSDFKYSFWIPQPKVVESKQEEDERKEREREQAIEEHKSKVNEQERANGLPLTVWGF